MGIQANNIIIARKPEVRVHMPIVEKVQPKEEPAPTSVSGQIRKGVREKYAQPEPKIKRRKKLSEHKPKPVSTYIHDMTRSML